MKKSLYLLLAILPLLTSCELYMDLEDEPTTPALNPYENVVKEETKNGLVYEYQFNEDTRELTEEYDKYIVANEGDSVLYFREDTPVGFTPKVDECLVSKFREKFRLGLCNQVTSVEKQNGMFKVTLERAALEDAFKEFRYDATNAFYPTFVIRDSITALENDTIIENLTRGGLTRYNYELNSYDPGLQAVSKIWAFEDAAVYEYLSPTPESQEKVKFQHVVNEKRDLSALFPIGKKGEHTQRDGTISGSYTHDSYVHTEGQDVGDYTGGNQKFKKITVEKYQIEIKINGTVSASAHPIKDWSNKFLMNSECCLGEFFGIIFYPDLVLSANLSGEGCIKFTSTVANEIEVEIDKFGHKTEKSKELKGLYGEGLKVDELEAGISGSLDLLLDVTFGVVALKSVFELGGFIQGGVTASLTIDNKAQENCRDLYVKELDRKYEASKDGFLKLNAHWGAGVHVRAGLPRYWSDDDDEKSVKDKVKKEQSATKKWEKYGQKDFDALSIRRENYSITIRYDIAKAKLGQTNKDILEMGHHPMLSTRKSSIVCTNMSEENKDMNKVSAKIVFYDKGEQNGDPHLIVLDKDDNFVKSIPSKNKVEHIVESLREDYCYDFDFELPTKGDDGLLRTEYHIFPCYYHWLNSTYYANMEFVVNTYSPNISIGKFAQRKFHEKMDEELNKKIFQYTMRGSAVLSSNSDIKYWGFIVKYLDHKVSDLVDPNSPNSFELGTIGEVEFKASQLVDIYKNPTKSLDFSLDFSSYGKSLHHFYIYLIPYYVTFDGKRLILYDKFKYTQVYDDTKFNDVSFDEDEPDLPLSIN